MSATAPLPEPEPTAAEILARAQTEGEWRVPVEMAVFCTTSAFKSLILQRYPGGYSPKKTCLVFARGDRFFAVVEFHGRDDLFIPLDVHTLENRP